MGIDTLKLAKKRAKKDAKITAEEPDIQMARDPEDVKSYERKKMDPGSSDANIKAAMVHSAYKYPDPKVPVEKKEEPEPDHKMMKQRKKTMMLRSLLKIMDDMDKNDNGIPDSEE